MEDSQLAQLLMLQKLLKNSNLPVPKELNFGRDMSKFVPWKKAKSAIIAIGTAESDLTELSNYLIKGKKGDWSK